MKSKLKPQCFENPFPHPIRFGLLYGAFDISLEGISIFLGEDPLCPTLLLTLPLGSVLSAGPLSLPSHTFDSGVLSQEPLLQKLFSLLRIMGLCLSMPL